MKLNKRDLKKIMYDFNCISNRLLQAHFMDYNGVLKKFIAFINSTSVISDYIQNCGECTQDLQLVFSQVASSHGLFELGETDEEEVRNVYSILEYIIAHEMKIYYGIGFGYSSSNKNQDMVKGFNERVVMILILHIESYLTKIGIEMGLDDTIMYNINHSGQVNIANDNAVINMTNNLNLDTSRLSDLMQTVRKASMSMSDEDKEIVSDSLEAIEEESASSSPKKGLIRTALNALKAIKGPVEFAAAVTELINFVAPFFMN